MLKHPRYGLRGEAVKAATAAASATVYASFLFILGTASNYTKVGPGPTEAASWVRHAGLGHLVTKQVSG